MNRDEIRAAILASSDIVKEQVPTPEWPEVDGKIWVRNMSAFAREQYLNSIRKVAIDPTHPDNPVTTEMFLEAANVKLCAATMCDEQGILLFTLEDVELLGQKSGTTMERIREVAARLNAMGKKASAEIKKSLPSVMT